MTKQKSTKRALLMSALALLMCVSMLVGSTFAWFTDNVTSAGNIIKSGTLEVEMYWANGAESPESATWKDASAGAIFNNDLWEPGYIEAKHIKISNTGSLALSYQLRMVANGVVSNLGDVIDVYYFDNATQLTRENVGEGKKLGTLTEIFGTEKNLSNAVYGDLLANEEKTVTIAFKMQESAGNEYQNLSIGSDFSVVLTAIQHTYEKDSFDEMYDENALSSLVPPALVRELENKDITATLGIGGQVYEYTLDTAYQFEPTQSYEELLKSEYKYYLADFIVSADKDVPANSIALAGYYDAWCQYNNDNWVALTNPEVVEAGTEIYLVGSMGYPVHYKDICYYGNDGIGFLCGAADLTGENAGTTITVKLCLFETTADPNGSSASTEKVEGAEPIVIGEFKYTFPEKPAALAAWENLEVVNGDVTRSNQIAKDYVEISHNSGNLTLENVTFENGLTIYTLDSNNNGTVTLEDCTIYLSDGVPANSAYNMCYADYGLNLTLANGSDITFKFVNCTFAAKAGHTYRTDDDKGYNVYIGPGYSANSIIFEGCTFEGSGKHGIGCSSTGDAQYYELNVTGCDFKNWNNNPIVTNGAAIRGNLPAADFDAEITISGNTFGNSNNSTQETVAIDSWTGTWN